MGGVNPTLCCPTCGKPMRRYQSGGLFCPACVIGHATVTPQGDGTYKHEIRFPPLDPAHPPEETVPNFWCADWGATDKQLEAVDGIKLIDQPDWVVDAYERMLRHLILADNLRAKVPRVSTYRRNLIEHAEGMMGEK